MMFPIAGSIQTLFLLTLLCIFSTSKALVRCNGNVTKIQLCSLEPTYQKGFSRTDNQGEPLKIWSSVHVKEIAELDQHRHTLTLDMVLSIWWYDTRITLESSNHNK